MKHQEIRDKARIAANISQFKSNHPYDHKSYEDGFYDGFSQALQTYNIDGHRDPSCCSQFQARENTTTQTICRHCGKEKWTHPNV